MLSASEIILSTSSLHVGISCINPATIPQLQAPASIVPSCIIFGYTPATSPKISWIWRLSPCSFSLFKIRVTAVTRILNKEKEQGDNLQIQDIFGEVAGVYPKIMQEGTMEAGAWSCGMVAGLIHDIPTCKELVDRIISDAESIINDRLSKVKIA